MIHAPARGLGDAEDPCHRCFETFTRLIDKYRSLYHFHGHVHLSYNHRLGRTLTRGGTTVVNASGKYLIELPDRE